MTQAYCSENISFTNCTYKDTHNSLWNQLSPADYDCQIPSIQSPSSTVYLSAQFAREDRSLHGCQVLLLGIVASQIEVGHRRPLCGPTQHTRFSRKYYHNKFAGLAALILQQNITAKVSACIGKGRPLLAGAQKPALQHIMGCCASKNFLHIQNMLSRAVLVILHRIPDV